MRNSSSSSDHHGNQQLLVVRLVILWDTVCPRMCNMNTGQNFPSSALLIPKTSTHTTMPLVLHCTSDPSVAQGSTWWYFLLLTTLDFPIIPLPILTNVLETAEVQRSLAWSKNVQRSLQALQNKGAWGGLVNIGRDIRRGAGDGDYTQARRAGSQIRWTGLEVGPWWHRCDSFFLSLFTITLSLFPITLFPFESDSSQCFFLIFFHHLWLGY